MSKLIAMLLMSASLVLCADITGTWNFEVQTDAGSGSPTFVLKQAGEKLTGTYSGALGSSEIRGSVKGNEVIIEFETEATGEKATVRYTGELDGDKKMKGKVTLGSFGGTFTGVMKD